MYYVKILKKNDRIMTVPHCMRRYPDKMITFYVAPKSE